MESFAQIRRKMFPEDLNREDQDASHPPIMIVDDNVDIIEALTNVLRSNYGLIPCLNYEEAIKSLVPEITVVLLDIKMPGKDGIELYKLLKEVRQDLQIIFHSAYPGSSEKALEIEQLSYSSYLTKGEYEATELLAAIEAAFRYHQILPPQQTQYAPGETRL